MLDYPGGRAITESMDIRGRLSRIDDPASLTPIVSLTCFFDKFLYIKSIDQSEVVDYSFLRAAVKNDYRVLSFGLIKPVPIILFHRLGSQRKIKNLFRSNRLLDAQGFAADLDDFFHRVGAQTAAV